MSETQQAWVPKAQTLITQLREMSHTSAKSEQEAKTISSKGEQSGKYEKMLADLVRLSRQRGDIPERADAILWRLWLTTGMAPVPRRQDESLSATLSRNASAYQRYIGQRAALTEEELGRQGLNNAVGSFGSPLWYTTMQYLTEKANVNFECHIFIDVFPRRSIIAQPLNSDSYNRLSSALAKWLDANEERMVWDQDASRFRPRKGGYVGVPELSEALLTASGKEENEQSVSGKKYCPPFNHTELNAEHDLRR
ncbi:MAG: hypothetical protein ACYC0X_34350 [Pirellulaceae bacterium]